MNTQTETIVFAGGGSKNPSLMMWPKPNEETKPTVISKFNHGYSVYALAVSPNAARVAAGTRAGLLQVHALSDFQASENSTPLFEIFHQPGIISLAFCTDDILASGGLNGKIKIWSVTQKRQLAEIEAHTQGVFALRQLGSLVLASIGGDNILRVWDMDTLEAKYESDPIDLPKIRALTCLDYNPVTKHLMHPSASGSLHMYDLYNNFAKHEVSVHDGDFSALACGQEYVVTAGSDDAIIKLWPASIDEPIAQVSASLGVLTAAWAGTGSIITVYTDGSGQIWKVDGRLSPGPRFYDLDLRTATGLPSELFLRHQLTANKQWRDKKLSQVKEFITDSARCSQIAATVNELRHKGFSVEAATVLADAAKAQNQPLWELESRLAIAEELGNNKVALPSLYALGKLLRKLNEPKLAQDYFKKILQIDNDYLDVNEQISNLQSDPIMQMCPEKDIRSELMQKGQGLQEIEKYGILNKKFTWRIIMNAGSAVSAEPCLDIKELTENILKALAKYNADIAASGLEDIKFLSDEELRKLTWIYVPSAVTDLPVAFAMELRAITSGTEFIPYGIFDAAMLDIPSSFSPKKHNGQIRKAWISISKSSKARDWLTDANKQAMKIVSQLGGRIIALQDDEF
ncbi:WD40 repeat domain-containing protein [Planctomycetota bacterium]